MSAMDLSAAVKLGHDEFPVTQGLRRRQSPIAGAHGHIDQGIAGLVQVHLAPEDTAHVQVHVLEQAMPVEAVQKATALSRNCDLFMVVGSTLLVQPAALMPQYAKDSNAFLAIVNLSETPYDAVCDVLIKAKAGAVLTEIVNSVKRLQAGNEP